MSKVSAQRSETNGDLILVPLAVISAALSLVSKQNRYIHPVLLEAGLKRTLVASLVCVGCTGDELTYARRRLNQLILLLVLGCRQRYVFHFISWQLFLEAARKSF